MIRRLGGWVASSRGSPGDAGRSRGRVLGRIGHRSDREGRPKMRSQRGGEPGSSILAAAVVLLSAATSVRAQPGFGPDPFWPYNHQYTPYTTSMGPATPGAGGRGAAPDARDGLRNANQFQNYIDNLSGPGRNLSDRSNV